MSGKEFLEIFLYPQNWNVQLNFVFIGLSLAYLFYTKPTVKGWQKGCFLLSMIIYFFALGSPLALLSHELFSIHMLQMSLLYFVVPPLLLLGLPSTMLRPLFRVKWFKKMISFLTSPFISLFLFNGLISLYHVPVVFDVMMSKEVYHVVSHIVLMGTSLCMWWPILAPIPELNTLKPLHRLALIFGNGILLTPACAMISFTDRILFDTYRELSLLVPVISPLHDQQFGGVIMKIIQEIVYITAICIVFFRWVRTEKRKDQKELERWKKEAILKNKEVVG